MKLTIARDALHEALVPLARIAPTKTTLPPLSQVIIGADGLGVTFGATDLEVAMERSVPAVVQEPGAICVSAATLSQYVATLPNGEAVTMEIDGNGKCLALTCGRSSANFAGSDPSQWPPIYAGGAHLAMTVPSARLRAAIGDVEYAASLDATYSVLAGIAMHDSDDGPRSATLAAADGYRMATSVFDVERPAGAPSDLAMVIPARSMRQILRVLPDDATPVEISVGAQVVRMQCGNTSVISRLITGTFPDYARIIPETTSHRVVVDRQALLAAVAMSRVFVTDAGRVTHLVVDPSAMTVTVSASGGEIGDGSSIVDLIGVDGEQITVSFNGRYLADAITRLRTDRVELACNGATAPGLIRPVGAEHDRTLAVVMPLNPGIVQR